MRLVTLIILVLSLAVSACGQPAQPPPAHVQCSSAGEIVFDQVFDKAEASADGTVTVWLDGQSLSIKGDCQVVP